MCLIQCCVLKEVNSGQQMKFSLCYPECLSVGKRSCDFQRDSLINQHQTGWLENVEDIYLFLRKVHHSWQALLLPLYGSPLSHPEKSPLCLEGPTGGWAVQNRTQHSRALKK